MAKITINEISDNYTYNIGVNSFATVALPITSSWGPAVLDPATKYNVEITAQNGEEYFKKSVADNKWYRFPATPQGLDAFIATFRGPSSTYKINKDYSYQEAVTLLTSGYDILVCRVASGVGASGKMVVHAATADPATTERSFGVKASCVGTFGNNIKVKLSSKKYTVSLGGVATDKYYWNVVVFVAGVSGGMSAVENLNFVLSDPTDHELPDYIDVLADVKSNFVTIANNVSTPVLDTDAQTMYGTNFDAVTLAGGADEMTSDATPANDRTKAQLYATLRYTSSGATTSTYPTVLASLPTTDATKLKSVLAMEFNYTAAYYAYAQLQDKLQYNPNRIVSPGWDDQNFFNVSDSAPAQWVVSPLHKAIMDAAYYGRCGAGLLDIPLSCVQTVVKDYAIAVSRTPAPNPLENNAPLYNTNFALFAPWGRYKLVGVSKMVHVSASLLALLISRAQILNQPIQYEWVLPTNKKHNLNIGELDYEVSTATLNEWQDIDEGVSINVIANIPGLGINVWGNSTLFEVPPATYQALANLSTRYLMNAIENVAYIVSLGITFTYSNSEALSSYVVGCSPILDTMKNVGAIEDYKIRANVDIDGNDHVNANTIIGKILVAVDGVVNDVVTDLYALPPNADLNQFGD
jgi:hypothetical protein